MSSSEAVVASIDLRGTSATLLKCDLAIVNGRGAWFNDRIVAFYGAYLQTQWDGSRSPSAPCSFVFGDPALLSFMCQYLDLSDAEECSGFMRGAFPELFPSDDVSSSSSAPVFLLLPVNEMYSTGAPPVSSSSQGSHWTLLSLLLSPATSAGPAKILEARYYDSMPSSNPSSSVNFSAARSLLKTLNGLLQSSSPSAESPSPPPLPQLFAGMTPAVRQSDGSSCGLYAVLFGMAIQSVVAESGRSILSGDEIDEKLNGIIGGEFVEEWRSKLRAMVKGEVDKYSEK